MPHQIMIVDDDEAMGRLLGLILRQAGFDVIQATSGMEALSLLNDRVPALFILDVMMPDMDGIELCREIRQIVPTPDIPVLMLSALKDKGKIEMALDAGANDYLTKPILNKDLKAAVLAYLG